MCWHPVATVNLQIPRHEYDLMLVRFVVAVLRSALSSFSLIFCFLPSRLHIVTPWIKEKKRKKREFMIVAGYRLSESIIRY